MTTIADFIWHFARLNHFKQKIQLEWTALQEYRRQLYDDYGYVWLQFGLCAIYCDIRSKLGVLDLNIYVLDFTEFRWLFYMGWNSLLYEV